MDTELITRCGTLEVQDKGTGNILLMSAVPGLGIALKQALTSTWQKVNEASDYSFDILFLRRVRWRL